MCFCVSLKCSYFSSVTLLKEGHVQEIFLFLVNDNVEVNTESVGVNMGVVTGASTYILGSRLCFRCTVGVIKGSPVKLKRLTASSLLSSQRECTVVTVPSLDATKYDGTSLSFAICSSGRRSRRSRLMGRSHALISLRPATPFLVEGSQKFGKDVDVFLQRSWRRSRRCLAIRGVHASFPPNLFLVCPDEASQ